MLSSKLTIFLPTFNRCENVVKQIQFLISSQIDDYFKIVVINDGSSDQTESELLQFDSRPNIKTINHPENLGYAQTHINCFTICDTEYLIFLTDDDDYFPHSLSEAETLLEKLAPDFLSCSWQSTTSTRKFTTYGEISFFNIWKSAKHAPGLIYKVSAVQTVLSKLQNELHQDNLVAFFFPQIFILFNLKCTGYKLFKTPLVIGKNPASGAMTTNANDKHGNNYFSLNNVIERHMAFQDFYKKLSLKFSCKEIVLIKDLHSLTLHNDVYRGALLNIDEISDGFMVSSLLSSLRMNNLLRSFVVIVILKYKIFLSKILNFLKFKIS
jgi:glycosyltransferase involved in cell wall biosynthesis